MVFFFDGCVVGGRELLFLCIFNQKNPPKWGDNGGGDGGTYSILYSGVDTMQLHSGAEHFRKVIYRGIITRGCS